MILNEAIERFIKWKGFSVKRATGRNYGVFLRQFCLFVRNCEIEEVKLNDIIDWFSLNLKTGFCDNNCLAPKRAALYEFFSFYKKDGHNTLEPSLIPSIRTEYREPRVADEKSYKKLLSAFTEDSINKKRDLAGLGMLHDTGVRIGELLSLNLPDIDVKKKKGYVETEKVPTHKPHRRLIVWTFKVNLWLKIWLEEREDFLKNTEKKSEAVFITLNRNNHGNRLSDQTFREMLRVKSREVGIPYVNPHAYRHLFGIEKAKGMDISTLATAMGHGSINSTFIYSRPQEAELEKKLRKMI